MLADKNAIVAHLLFLFFSFFSHRKLYSDKIRGREARFPMSVYILARDLEPSKLQYVVDFRL